MRVFYPRLSREEILEGLRRGAAALAAQLPLAEVALFGSYASGRQTAASDVDVLVIYRGAPRNDAFALAKRLLGVPRAEPHVYSEDEAGALASIIDRMRRGGVRVYP